MADFENPFSYIFNAQPRPGMAVPSYEQLQTRRKIAASLMAQKHPYPRNIGEGLSAIGEAIGERGYLNRLDAMEAVKAQQDAALMAGVTRAGAAPPAPSTPSDSSETETAPPAARTSYAPPATPDEAPAVAAINNAIKPGAAGRSLIVPPAADATAPNDGSYNAIDAQVAFKRKTPGYIADAIARNVQDPDMAAYLGSLVAAEAPNGPHEVSSTGAAGPFQFTHGTARQYGLIDQTGDRRADLDASVQAAERLTRDNARVFKQINGRDASPAELALMHQQGGVTGARMVAGTGNAPPGNLAVNNINPAAGPAAAVARIKQFYGMPDAPMTPRDQVAASLASAAPGGPQPNPTPPEPLPVQGRSVVPTSSLAIPGGSNALAFAPTTTGIPAAPTVPSAVIKAPPVQLAQAVPPQLLETQQIRPDFVPTMRVPTSEPKPPPVPQPTPKMRAIEQALTSVGDPYQRDALTRMYQQEQADLTANYNQAIEIYKHKRDLWEAAPQKQQELIKATEEADVARRTGGLGNEPLLAPLIKSAESNKGLLAAAQALRNAREEFNKGIVSGAGADARLNALKTRELIGSWFGIDSSDPRVANTEAFNSTIMPLVAQMRSTVSGNANISDADINLARSAVAGNIELDEKTFPRVLNALERINLGAAIGHQQRILGAAAGSEKAANALQGVYGLPMDQIIPEHLMQRLRDHPETAAEFDAYFKTPGLARKILGAR